MVLEQRRLASRIAASVVVAIFAYLGLLFGGNIVIGPSATPNSLSSSSRDLAADAGYGARRHPRPADQ